MIGPSKILTVSYGTFSCTLEGFDDPFNTMRAIAEYFRDLAAEDRYFGATPPTPDAEMLHRIAEREIHRRVEARVGEEGIVLRAADEPIATPVAAPRSETSAAALAAGAVARTVVAPAITPAAGNAAAPEPAAEEEGADRPDSIFADDIAVGPEAAPDAADAPAVAGAAAPAADHDSSDVAAKLARIRAVIAAAQAAKTAPAAPAADAAAEAGAAAGIAAGIAAGADFEEEESPAAGPAAFEEEPESGPLEAVAAVDDDFGFDLELDELHAVRPAAAAPAAAEPAPEMEEVAGEFAEELTSAGIAEPAAEAAAVLSGEEAPEAAELISEPLPEPLSEPLSEPLPEAAESGEETAEDWTPESAQADEAMEDEDYAALALATLTGAEPEAPAETRAETDAGAAAASGDEALDLSGWRVAEAAADVEVSAEETAGEDTGDEWDDGWDDDFAAVAEDAEAGKAAAQDDAEGAPAATEPAERRPGFFERARARVIKIRRGAASGPEAEPETEAEAEPAGAAAHGLPSAEAAGEEPAPAAGAAMPEAAEAGDDAAHAAIFAALNEADGGEPVFEDDLAGTAEEAEAAEAGAEDAAILAGIGAAIGAAGTEAQEDGEDDDDDTLLNELSAIARDARRDAHEGRAILEDQAGDGEASVERLMEEAKSKLEGVESRRRFSAIAHLKAAVAATVADRKLKSHDVASDEGASPVEDIERYRDDLSKAVRPRRPTTEGAAMTRRPEISDRPAPLVLVSEQRVDLDDETVKPAATIRPRRIGAAALTVAEVEDDFAEEAPLSPEEARNFAEFADRLGAANLAELLEAAAAYTATVEGMPHFSRPHILRKVSGYTEEDEFTREDGLRSFGMLLRQGKIQKISRGQFTITEASRFMSEARRAAR